MFVTPPICPEPSLAYLLEGMTLDHKGYHYCCWTQALVICEKMGYLYPRHTKYLEGYIVFVFPSIPPSFRPCVCLVLTFYVKVLHEVFFYTSRNGAGRGYLCPTGHLFLLVISLWRCDLHTSWMNICLI